MSRLAALPALLSLLVMLPLTWAWAQGTTLVCDQAENAGMDGRDWDKCFPGARTVDAAQRSVLLRFPGAAEQIAARLAEGLALAKVEVVLDFADYEINPSGYICRTGLGEKKWRENPPNWHVVAWALRKPWHADAESGPTFNAYINGAGYWARWGASDPEKDRFPKPFAPAELSVYQREARIDVTPAATNASFGASLGERLRALEEHGFLLRKLETYDMRYRDWWDAYEWAVPTGGHGLTFANPRLVVTFRPGTSAPVSLPPATDLTALASRLIAEGSGGTPTAVLPSEAQLQDLAQRLAFRQPAWMPDWQWERVKQLHELGGSTISQWESGLVSGDPARYRRVIMDILTTAPRYWKGWDIQSDLLLLYLYREALPAFVLDYLRQYWLAWLMPDLPTDVFFHPQSQENEKYWQETGDWRGRTSFFRDGYMYNISTMNFNHTSAMGALLGGAFVGSEYAMADGRHGLENFPLRLWCWFDGSTQESIDHYYFAITLSGQKMFADFGPSQLDRMMGRSILAKSVDELTSSWHPGLRRFISSSTRTSLAHLLVKQDGLCHIMHTLSHGGALHDIGNEDTLGISIWGHDFPPGRVALQTLPAPWAPEFVAYTVDEKPLPFEMTNTYKVWGNFAATPLWRRTYLGRHYGVASLDVSRNESVPMMVQWRRQDQPVERLDEVGTLIGRYGLNETNLLKTSGGGMAMQGGSTATLQHKNKLLFLASPLPKLEHPAWKPPEEIRSLQLTLGILNFQQPPTWRLFVDDQPVMALPRSVKAGQRIVIHDGVSYVGIIPLPATDLGRSDEVLITEGPEQEPEGGGKAKIALLIESFNRKQDAPLNPDQADWQAIDEAYNGFVIEVGDVSEYPSLADFSRHLRQAQLETRYEAETKTLHVTYKSGGDTLECGYRTDYGGDWNRSVPTDQCFPYRRVNGAWPYLPPGLDRDSTLAQQGTSGRLEKNGATLTCEPFHTAFLQTEPITGTYAGHNPLPDPILWSMTLPGGAAIRADGRLSMTRVIAVPRENRLTVDYATKADQTGPDLATCLLVSGWREQPVVVRNGEPVPLPLKQVRVGAESAWVIPLTATPPDLQALPERARRAQEALEKITAAANRPRDYAQDWLVVGPFPNVRGAGFNTVYPPEHKVDLAATYEGVEGARIAWKRVQPEGAPAVASRPIDLLGLFEPNKAVCAYAYTEIIADRDCTVTLYTGCNERLAIWVNGALVLRQPDYRGDAPDQDRVQVQLKKGANPVLCKLCHGHEGWNFYLRLGDEFGLPVEGLTFRAPPLPTTGGQ